MEYDVHSTPVLIVGGGLVGLCASLALSHQGVDSVLVERRAATSPQPKARRINIRSMELFRQWGIEREVIEAAAGLADFQFMAAGPTLARAQRLPFTMPGGPPDFGAISPAGSVLCAQDLLEPVLRGLAADRGGDIRFGTEVVGLTEDGDHVTATLRAPDGSSRTIHAAYAIAADGARSPIRTALGISRSGRGTLGRAVNVYIRADLSDVVRGREFNLCQIESAEAPGVFASINGTDRWIYSTGADPDRDADDWADVVRAAIGVPGLDVAVLSVLTWEPGMFVADRYARGRVFLAGDAAHVMPPYAAAGANTGIQDVHNLAWKLALVLRGQASRALLDSYHAERRPVGWYTADQSSIRSGNLREMQTSSTDGTPLAHPIALILGHQYRAGALIGDGSTAAMDHLDLTGQPGTRLPHRWLGAGRSTLDLIGPRLTVLTGPDDVPWAGAAATITMPELTLCRIDDPDWPKSVGIGDDGALLVRPDQVIAWRCVSPAGTARARLHDAIGRVLP